jgi:hypothetical protein
MAVSEPADLQKRQSKSRSPKAMKGIESSATAIKPKTLGPAFSRRQTFNIFTDPLPMVSELSSTAVSLLRELENKTLMRQIEKMAKSNSSGGAVLSSRDSSQDGESPSSSQKRSARQTAKRGKCKKTNAFPHGVKQDSFTRIRKSMSEFAKERTDEQSRQLRQTSKINLPSHSSPLQRFVPKGVPIPIRLTSNPSSSSARKATPTA